MVFNRSLFNATLMPTSAAAAGDLVSLTALGFPPDRPTVRRASVPKFRLGSQKNGGSRKNGCRWSDLSTHYS
jgi:hypothetical protein